MNRGVDEADRVHMAEAIELASRTARRPWPNPPVGAVVVRDGEVIARGAHEGPGTAHAEVVALAEAGQRARGATLYCTLEPCNHHGRTPPCAPAVVRSGVTRLVTAVADPNTRVCGGGFDVVRGAGIEVVNGVLAEQALELLWPFVVTRAFERPFVLLKTAVSLDGLFAPLGMDVSSGALYLTASEARRDVHRLRRWCDVVLVGSRTALVDRPRLDARMLDASDACPAADPIPAYVTTNPGSVDPFAGRPHIIFTGESADPWRDASTPGQLATTVRCRVSDGLVDVASLVSLFRQVGCCLMVEGGPTLAASFLRSGLVDRWVAYTAPVVLGSGVTWPGAGKRYGSALPGHPAACTDFTLTRVERCGEDAKAVFDRQPFSKTLVHLGRQLQESTSPPPGQPPARRA